MHRSEEIQKHQKSGAESIPVWQPLWHFAVILISGTTAGAAYISAHTDLLGNVFGQQSRTTKEAYDTVVDNGKGGTTVTMPSREYVAVDEAQAEKTGGALRRRFKYHKKNRRLHP